MTPNLKTFQNRPLKPLKLTKSNPQVPNSEAASTIHCKYCGNRCIKNGLEKNGKQRYKCNSCKKNQQSVYRYQAYDKNLNQNIMALWKPMISFLDRLLFEPIFYF